jgi:hypothetical protein
MRNSLILREERREERRVCVRETGGDERRGEKGVGERGRALSSSSRVRSREWRFSKEGSEDLWQVRGILDW